MPFEKVEKKWDGHLGGPTLSIVTGSSSPGGRFNVDAQRECLDDVDTVGVYADPSSQTLGFSVGERGYTIGSDGHIALSRALSSLDIDREGLEDRLHVPVEWDADEGLLIADIGAVLAESGGDA